MYDYRLRAVAALLATAVSMFASHASAQGSSAQGLSLQTGGEGEINAVAYSPLPPGASIRVRPLDNSDINLVLQKEFERHLHAKGYRVADDGAYVLSFDTRNEAGAWVDKGRRTILELDAHGGREGGEFARARLNIFDSQRGGLINEGDGGTAVTTPAQSSMEVTIDDKSGRRVWQAWTSTNLKFTDSESVSRAIVPAVVDELGRPVTRKLFRVQ